MRFPSPLSVLVLVLVALAAPAVADDAAGVLLEPAVHDDFVVFVRGGDVWRAPVEGGRAYRLTSHPGVERTPRVSPDGRLVAYTAEHVGSRQVFVMPSEGGPSRQLTFYADVGPMPPRGGFDYWIQGFRPDGTILVRMNRTPWGPRPGRYFLVSPDGGLERPLPIPIGGSASFSPDGTALAYTYFDREFRTWKRYVGGRNQDIWTYDLEAAKSRRLTTWEGSDNFPMWIGDAIWFTSDREGTMNLFSVDVATGEIVRRTDFDGFDVLWPSAGPAGIVFARGGSIWRHDPATGTSAPIPIEIADVPSATQPHWRDVRGDVASADVSPDGKRVVVEARGDLFSVPAEHGVTRNLSNTQGVRESAPAWSPDGRFIAYYSDAGGEMDLYVRAQDGSGEARRLTSGEAVGYFPPAWSPDSSKIAFGDTAHRLNVADVDSGAIRAVATGRLGDLTVYRWSPDSRFLAYEAAHPETDLPAIAVFGLDDGTTAFLGDGLTFDSDPAFGADGNVLFFRSQRDYNLRFSDFEFNFVYDDASRIFVATLRPDAPAPFPERNDEVAIENAAKANGKESGKKKGKGDEDSDDDGDDEVRVRIEAEGFPARTVALPGLEPGNYGALAAVEGGLLYVEQGDDGPRLMRYDLEAREAKEVAPGVGAYVLAARGGHVLARRNGAWSILPSKPNGGEAKTPDLSGLRMKVDPRLEWRQMFDEAWRIGRDWFYDENMHGVDWAAMRERYGALVPRMTHRADLDFILGEMIAELEAGHAYVQGGGDRPAVERVDGGMLGAEFEADPSGRYRIAKIFPGENWDPAFRSPLTEPGVDVDEGDFLLAIDGRELTVDDNPFRLLEGKGDRVVMLAVGDSADPAKARDVAVRTVSSEGNLRYLDWVLSRMELVDRLSGGRIGYVHLPNTAVEGNRMLQKLFYSQSAKPALIVDDRYNGGGFIPDRMIEVLSRTTLSYWARRGIESFSTPGFAHDGPKAMLINGYAASGGDALPYYFRQQGLGTLIGTRTWGGLIGISGNPMLVDGGGVLYPTFRFYGPDGDWAVENEGVAPDIEVWDLPEAIAAGGDPSIERAVEVLLRELEAAPPVEPARPTPPDMTAD